MVAEALAPLGEDYVANFKCGLAERWIDVYENSSSGHILTSSPSSFA